MPGVQDNLNKIGSISAADTNYYEFLDQVAKKRRDLEKDILNDRMRYEAELRDYQENTADYIANFKKKLELEAQKDEFEREKTFQKKLLDLEKKGLKLTQKEKDALRKKEQKDKEKEEAKARREAKKEISAGIGADLADQLKAGLIDGSTAAKKLFSQATEDLKNFFDDPETKAAMQANFVNIGSQFVNTAMSTIGNVYSKISARLQASGESFQEINARMQLQLAASPFIKYTDMLAKVDELVDRGVAYNVEQRAFLASISDKIATTFDAFDSNLLRIIRIQQEDSTKQRLGMEARLTEFLNKEFQDTSYLSGAHDSVTEALTASIVQLGTSRGAEYEYTVQKWFGSLAALGLSDNALTGLANAINSAATGDVESLAGSPYQNLIVMAANRAGISYGDILTQGLNSDSVNSLIQSIVSYWGTIATETNQVVRNQYGKLFGLDMTDLTAIKNITNADLNKISNESLTYRGMRTELTEQMAKIILRMHPAELLNNVWDNFMMGMGLNIASNPLTATTWLINDFIEQATGGINIPSLGAFAMGTGVSFDLEANVNQLIKLGMVGMSTLGQVSKVIAGLGGLGGLNLAFWGADQYTRHGSGLSAPVTGVSASTSQTTFIGNASSSDIYAQTLNQAKDDAGYNEIVSQTQTDAQKAKEQMDNLESDVHQIMEYLRDVFTGSALRVRVEDYGLVSSFGV